MEQLPSDEDWSVVLKSLAPHLLLDGAVDSFHFPSSVRARAHAFLDELQSDDTSPEVSDPVVINIGAAVSAAAKQAGYAVDAKRLLQFLWEARGDLKKLFAAGTLDILSVG